MAFKPVMEKEVLYLTRKDVEKVLPTMPDCIDLMEKVYIEKGNGTVIFPPKHPMNPAESCSISAMPGVLFGMQCAGTKVISGFPTNYEKGYTYVHGLYVLMDIHTGIPLSVMDCVALTGLRTGAVTGLAAKYMANKDSESVLLYGAGTQGRMGLDAYVAVLPNLKRVHITDRVKATEERYVQEMGAKYPGLEILPITDLEAAVRDSDIINSCIPSDLSPELQVIKKEWLKPNITNMPVDGGCAYKPDVMDSNIYARTYTDDVAQHQHFQSDHFCPMTSSTPIELGDVVTGKAPGRLSHDERILTVLWGTGLADLGTAKYIYDKAIQEGVGTIMPL